MFVNTCNTIFVDIIPLCPHDEEKLEHVVIFRGWNTISKYVVTPPPPPTQQKVKEKQFPADTQNF